MRKILFILLLSQVVYAANAQVKLYIDDNGRPTDVFKATSYIIVKQLSDTAWQMDQYDMENASLQSGTFKDASLKMPDGKFVYYRKLNFYNNKQMKEWLKSDTANCVMTEGQFKNGKKDGTWTDYFIGGKKREEATYKDGVLNGPYRSYNNDHSTVALSGNYVNGMREGDWEMFNMDGKVMETDKYRNGKMHAQKMSLGPYNPPKPPRGFETYVTTTLRKTAPAPDVANIAFDYSFVFTVTKDGKVIDAHVVETGHDDDPLARTLVGIIQNSSQWKPANTGDETKAVEDFAIVSVEIKKGGITTKVLDYGKYKAAYFNLNH
ncbi:MAG TPA: hypothetical protein VG367_15490 [Mucilaginibacter sp.]|jgi:antitoxin component YwqK of YwqJK toxin-antitoxin module|nr:hypothetical protein [Mucilaginibacter sp.]